MLDEHTMRGQRADARPWSRWRIRAALFIVCCYAALAASTQFGANIAGQGADPVWAAARERGALRVATDFGYAPFTGMRTVGTEMRAEPFGYDIDLARALAKKLGFAVQFVPVSLESAYEALANDSADLVVSALPYAPEQGWRASFSTFYFNAGQVLVVRADSPLVAADQLGAASVAVATVGVALGSDADTFARALAARSPTVHVRTSYDTPAQALDALRAGAVDAAIVDNAAALTALNSAPGLRFVPPALTLEPYAIAVSNRAFLLHDQIDGALDTLRKEGFFEANGRKWFVDARP